MPRVLRRRPWVIVLLALASAGSAGCGGDRDSDAPLVKSDSLEVGGRPVLGSAPSGLTLRFIERGRFGIGIVLRNTSHRSLTVVDVRTPDPLRGLVHQVGTRLVPWNPPRCPRHRCLVSTYLHTVYGESRPEPVTVAPGKAVAAQLNYRLDSCAAVPLASAAAAAKQLDVAYRYGTGRLRRQALPLGSAQLRLRRPTPSDCARRPRSEIALDGPFATSSDWTIPGSGAETCTRTAAGTLQCSGGDTCTRTADGALRFHSGLYQSGGKPTVRVEIRLPRFRGDGLYRTLPRPARALGPAQVLVTVGIGAHGWTTFRSSTSVVTLTRATETTFGGRFHATLPAWRGTPFRAFGAWRCTTSKA